MNSIKRNIIHNVTIEYKVAFSILYTLLKADEK